MSVIYTQTRKGTGIADRRNRSRPLHGLGYRATGKADLSEQRCIRREPRDAPAVRAVCRAEIHLKGNRMNGAVQDLAAEALFVSDMQPSECPSQHDIELAIIAMLLCYGSDGCAAECAAEFGDHPEAAVRRMFWVRSELAFINAW
jgi:hypothetical protein